MRAAHLIVVTFAITVSIRATVTPSDLEVIRTKGEMVVTFVKEGKLDDAVAAAKQLVDLGSSKAGPKSFLTASFLKLLGGVYQHKGDYSDAKATLTQALQIVEEIKGPHDVAVANFANQLAVTLMLQGDYEHSGPLLDRALELKEASKQPEDELTATILNNMAELDRSEGLYPKAEIVGLRTLALEKQLHGTDSAALATVMSNLAVTYQKEGKYAQAEPLLKQAVDIQTRMNGRDSPFTATALLNLGCQYRDLGQYRMAEPLLNEALAIREKRLGPSHPETATALDDLGGLYEREADFDDALPLHQRALDIRKRILGPGHALTADSLNSLGAVYHRMGDYVRAEDFYRQGLETREEYLGRDHPDTAMSLDNLGVLYIDLGRYEQAVPLFERALAIVRKIKGVTSSSEAIFLNNEATAYRRLLNGDKAETLLKQAIQIDTTSLGPENPQTVNSISNLAEVYSNEARYKQADPLARQALQIREKIEKPDSLLLAISLNNVALLDEVQGRFKESKDLYIRALAIQNTHPGADYHGSATTLSNLADLSWKTGDVAEAVEYCQKEFQVDENALEQILLVGSEDQKRAFAETFEVDTSGLISFDLNVQFVPATELAFEAICQRKGRVLEAQAAELKAARRSLSNDPAFVEFLKVERQLANLTVNSSTMDDSASFQEMAASLKNRYESLQSQLSKASLTFRATYKAVKVDELRRCLPVGSALVEIVRYTPFQINDPVKKFLPRHYAAYILTPSGKIFHRDLGEAARIDELCHQFVHSLASDVNAAQSRKVGRELDQLIMQPLEASLGASTQVFLSPDGELNLIPFAALVDGKGDYLLAKYDFNYLGSGQDLLRLQDQPRNTQTVIVVANPDFGAAISNGCHFDPLPASLEEAQMVREHFSSATLVMGPHASKQMLQDLKSPFLLHIATHGFFDQAGNCVAKGSSAMFRSGIALAGANQSNRAGGILTAAEMAQLDLDGTQLVVLSSCESGQGESQAGEGVFGMRRALVIAGARTQLISLWAVDDEKTRELMESYYDLLAAGVGRSAALKQAQAARLKEGWPAASWAAFIISGDWRPMEVRNNLRAVKVAAY